MFLHHLVTSGGGGGGGITGTTLTESGVVSCSSASSSERSALSESSPSILGFLNSFELTDVACDILLIPYSSWPLCMVRGQTSMEFKRNRKRSLSLADRTALVSGFMKFSATPLACGHKGVIFWCFIPFILAQRILIPAIFKLFICVHVSLIWVQNTIIIFFSCYLIFGQELPSEN